MHLPGRQTPVELPVVSRFFSDVPATRAEDIMDPVTGSNDLGTLGLGLLIAGAAAGLFSGVLGRGAGLILVPALYLALSAAGVAAELRLHLAMGTTLACLLPWRWPGWPPSSGSVDWKLAKAVIGPLVIGVVSGAAMPPGIEPNAGTDLRRPWR